jgi:hypothetical protein
MRDKMRDGLVAEKQPTWTNAPLVRSARAAGGKRLDSRDPRILARQGGDQAVLNRMRLKWASGGRRPASRPSPLSRASQARARPSLTLFDGFLSSRAATSSSRSAQAARFFETPLLRVPVRAAGPDARITAAAIPLRPKRRTKPRPPPRVHDHPRAATS